MIVKPKLSAGLSRLQLSTSNWREKSSKTLLPKKVKKHPQSCNWTSKLLRFSLKQNRMKQVTTAFLILSAFIGCNAQTNTTNFNYDDFEKQVIAYKPKQNDLSEKDFKRGTMILEETKKATKNNPVNFNRADYYNVLSSFLSLKETDENIKLAFEKFKNSEGCCEYFLAVGLFSSSNYDLLRPDIDEQIAACSSSSNSNSNSFDLKAYALENKLDYDLIRLLDDINEGDIKYRKEATTDWAKQTPIDKENQQLIDSLYHSHKEYLGTSLVGEKYNSVMWTVIQHSNLQMMENYLPVIQEAVEQGELDSVPFKMLIDRIYTQKHNYQIFGSQTGVAQASDEVRKAVIAKYNLE